VACKRVVWAEVIPPLAELQERLDRAERREQSMIDCLAPLVTGDTSLDELVALQIKDLRQLVDWRARRQSPPRCLECGSTNFMAMAAGRTHSGRSKWTLSPHPGCDGALTVLPEPVLVLDRGWIIYSPEGL
jgi:hypothetical protein